MCDLMCSYVCMCVCGEISTAQYAVGRHPTAARQFCRVSDKTTPSAANTMKKKKNSTRNKSQTQRARAYEVTSFLSTDIRGFGGIKNKSWISTD